MKEQTHDVELEAMMFKVLRIADYTMHYVTLYQYGMSTPLTAHH